MIKDERQDINNRPPSKNKINYYEGLDSDLEKMFDSFIKNNQIDMNQFQSNLKEGEKILSSGSFKYINKKLSTFSKENGEFYFLIATTSVKKEINKKNEYYLLTFSMITYCIKSTKKINFDLEIITTMSERNVVNIKIDEIILHQNNQNQLCLMGLEYLAFISDLKKDTSPDKEDLTIKIIHTSLLEKDQKLLKKENLYKKVKFAEYDNYFGVLSDTNTFRLYSIDSRVSKCVISNISKDIEVVDFSFGPLLNFGWINFSIFFLDTYGGILYTCPIFPEEFSTTPIYLKTMANFLKNSKISETNKDISEEHFRNENILNHFQMCMKKDINDFNISQQNENITLKIDDYLKTFNKKPNLCRLVTFDKRKKTDLLLLNANGNEKVTYKNIHILNLYPLIILRTTDTNFIDVIVCFEDIIPIRKTITSFTRDAYLIETIYLKNLTNTILSLKISELKLNLLKSDDNYTVIVNFLNDIYEIDLSYLKNLSEYYEYFSCTEDMKFDFHSKVSKVFVFKYNGILNKESNSLPSNIYYGYYFIDKVYDHYILVSFIKNKFYVKEYHSKNDEEEKGIDSIQIRNTSDNLKNIESRLKKIYFNSSIPHELAEINFENLYNLANKALTSSSEADASIGKSIRENPIINKQIVLDENNLKRISLNNLEDFIQFQIEGLYNHYDSIYTTRSSNMNERIKIMNEISKKFDLNKIINLKKEIESDVTKIDKLKNEVVDKKKTIEDKTKKIEEKLIEVHFKNKNVLEKYFSLKGFMDSNMNNYRDLKKSAEEIKQEFFRQDNEEKNTKIIEQTLDPKLIDKELINKQKGFEEHMKNLISNLRSSAKKLNSFTKLN